MCYALNPLFFLLTKSLFYIRIPLGSSEPSCPKGESLLNQNYGGKTEYEEQKNHQDNNDGGNRRYVRGSFLRPELFGAGNGFSGGSVQSMRGAQRTRIIHALRHTGSDNRLHRVERFGYCHGLTA